MRAGIAEIHYNNAITASIEYWGGTAQDATNYLATTNVAYTTAPGNYKQKIGTQSWLAYYNRGVMGWTTYRRLDYPVMNLAANAGGELTPKRYTYPINEQTLNGANYGMASSAIGGDLKSTKLWWDLN